MIVNVKNDSVKEDKNMLRLEDIIKDYKVADSEVHALKGINLAFRENEFVSILGPSGCGKTTLLNIIGGLDKYTSGNLSISGRSTAEFVDRDWDVYRNHRVGFIFQSYNLIPHQTVLGNVELALTIAGLSKSERQKKAKLALDRVGLTDQYYKRPNQLSGGQCQRVAIARALVNDPEILLADEPTGALDTETSIQIMEIIKEIAHEKLVIMVTHNPELAEKYSTRIIKLLDGELLSDSNPYNLKIEKLDTAKRNAALRKIAEEEFKQTGVAKKEKAKMSFWTAFRLSLNNLVSKKARTIMTSIAGSIGIIGVSLVLSISYGIQSYIDTMQNDMLSGYPIKISKTALDLSAMMDGMTIGEKIQTTTAAREIGVDSLIDMLVERATVTDGMMISNEITQEYVDFVKGISSEDAAAIYFNYGIDITNNIYTDFTGEGGTVENMSLSAMRTVYTSILKQTPYSDYASLITTLSDVFMQSPNNEDYILSQYDIMEGKFATEEDEVMIVLEKGSLLTDLLLAQLGYYTQDEFVNLIAKAGNDVDNYDKDLDKEIFTYDELLGREFNWYPNDTVFAAQTIPMLQETRPFTYKAYSDASFEASKLPLKIVGILQPKSTVNFGALQSGFFYTEALADKIIETNINSEIVTTLSTAGLDGFQGTTYKGSILTGITYDYHYSYNSTTYTQTGLIGKTNMIESMIGSMMGGEMPESYTITLQQLGGSILPDEISIYPTNFDLKDNVTKYLDQWNEDIPLEINGVVVQHEDRNVITYTDNLAVIISTIDSLINIITIALVGFTSLALVVSCVMIAIITYVSVVERIKEIGVIRSLGGRKKDVSRLFNAETFMIGFASGVIGITVTYALSALINLIVYGLTGIAIAKFPISYAATMMLISILLTTISGLIPSRSAAKKDPVVALRSE